MCFPQKLELVPEVVEPFVDRGQILAVILARTGLVGIEPDAFIGGLLEDDRVEPLADRDAGPASGLTRRVPCLRVDALHVPRRRSHSSTRTSTRRTRTNAHRG